MKSLMDVSAIVKLKQTGMSNREVAKRLGIDKNTVAKYWKRYKISSDRLEAETNIQEKVKLQEAIISPPKYDSSKRTSCKRSQELYSAIERIIESEKKKDKYLGANKQALTKTQIHKIIRSQGFDVSYSTVNLAINELRGLGKECFIRQKYDLGDRLEYDFGEVKLMVGGERKKYYMAVLASPGSGFRWCYLYENSKKEVFLESHVRFFEMIGGVWPEVVYDNMRNVVSKFLGKNEKELNLDLIKLSLYYGFRINVTNAFSGNEKGFVEGSVKKLRNQIFAERYSFPDKKSAVAYMEDKLRELNANSKINKEKLLLAPAKPPLELADVRKCRVDKCGYIRIENNFYSVPEYLVGFDVIAKICRTEILIYSNNDFVCSHNKKTGTNEYSDDIRHFLNTLYRKPGALRNSRVLKNHPEYKLLFDRYYSKNTQKAKEFIETIRINKDKKDEEILSILKKQSAHIFPISYKLKFTIKDKDCINKLARGQMQKYNQLTVGVK